MKLQPKKIMCAVDFSDFTDTILSYSIALCKELHAKLFLVHIVIDVTTILEHNETALDAEVLQRSHIRNAQKFLEDLVKDLTIENEFLISRGNPADEISRLALEQKTDMVITATHGKSGVKRFLIGSVTEKLMKTLHCPLLVLHTRKHDFKSLAGFEMKLKKILVGCDFSPDSKLALNYGLNLAQKFQAELYLAHVIKPTEYEEKREKDNELRGRLKKQLHIMIPEECLNWCTPKTILLDGEPYKELMNYVEEQEIDMIVLGIRGHTLWEKLLVGSTTDRVIRHSPCPVMAVRQMDEDKV